MELEEMQTRVEIAKLRALAIRQDQMSEQHLRQASNPICDGQQLIYMEQSEHMLGLAATNRDRANLMEVELDQS